MWLNAYMKAQPAWLFVAIAATVVYFVVLSVYTQGLSKREFYPVRRFWGIFAEPTKLVSRSCGMLPILAIVLAYISFSNYKLAENPQYKLTPSIGSMIIAFDTYATEPVKWHGLSRKNYLAVKVRYRTILDKQEDAVAQLESSVLMQKPHLLTRVAGVVIERYVYGIPKSRLYIDTVSSLSRIFWGVFLAAITGFLIGLNTGRQPGMRDTLQPSIKFASIVPPLAILPILLTFFGLYETGKIALIFIGTVFFFVRAIQQRVEEIPQQTITKLFSLGASEFQVIYCGVLWIVLPWLLRAVRLAQGPAWLFLIAAEGTVAESGLGLRIFTYGRNSYMNYVVPIVFYITALGYASDMLLQFGDQLFFARKRAEQ